MELFERVVTAGGQLLRVDFEGSGSGSSSLLLTFDVGRLLVRADPATGELQVEVVESRTSFVGELLPAEEEEPWWRVIGNPLARVSAAGHGLRLQFRADGDSPRTIELSSEGHLVCAALT
jgi:hypothetical protein